MTRGIDRPLLGGLALSVTAAGLLAQQAAPRKKLLVNITWTNWPEFGRMIGGYFDEHPWNPFAAPILVEDSGFPGMSQWPAAFTLTDEIYQIKNYSRQNTRVLMCLDAARLDLKKPKVRGAAGAASDSPSVAVRLNLGTAILVSSILILLPERAR